MWGAVWTEYHCHWTLCCDNLSLRRHSHVQGLQVTVLFPSGYVNESDETLLK